MTQKIRAETICIELSIKFVLETHITNYEQCYVYIYRFGVGVHISAFKHYRKMKFRIQLHLTIINKM